MYILVVVTVLALLMSASCLIATGLGWKIGSIVSGSMDPDLKVGELAIAEPLDPSQVRSGDIIAFRSPEDPDTIVTHRVIGIVDSGDSISFQTKGDANHNPDRFLVPAENVEGRVALHVPYLGYFISFSQTHPGFAIIVVIPITALIIGWIVALRGPTLRMRREAEAVPAPAQ